jgi:hypothetical protein
VHGQVDDHAVTGVVGVERVVHVAGVEVDPDDVVVAAVAGQQTHAGAVVGRPVERQAGPGHGGVEVEEHGQVEQDHPGVGEAHVVHHDRCRQLDLDGAGEEAVGAHDVVAQRRRAEAVGEHVHVTGDGVELGVGVDAAGQRPAEVAGGHGVEVRGELEGQ